MKKPQTKKRNNLSRRLHFPEDEKSLSWLPLLLDAYAIADTGVAIVVREEEKRRKRRLACAKGCDVCCRQTDIPLYPHELVGIYWFASEKLATPLRAVVRDQLHAHTKGSPCPFLIDGACVIHPVRPISCRQYNVFITPCAPGEDPYYTRRDDVLVPLGSYTDRAFEAVMPFYDMRPEGDNAKSVKLIRSRIMNLQSYDWKKLLAVIEQAGSRKPE